MKGIEGLNIKELKELLTQLKLYKDMTKKLGQRGRALFHRNLEGVSLLQVEYFPSVSKDSAFETAKTVYKKVFSIEPSREEIVFIKKESILGGMKVFKDDAMVDMSFSKVERLLRK